MHTEIKSNPVTLVEEYQFLELYDLVKSMQEKIDYLESKIESLEDNLDNLRIRVGRCATRPCKRD